MSTEGEYDCIVIGAGVQGSFTAHELVKKKQRTLLLEQVCVCVLNTNINILCNIMAVLVRFRFK